MDNYGLMQTIEYTINICRMVSLSLSLSIAMGSPELCLVYAYVYNTTNISHFLAKLCKAHLLLHLVKGLRFKHLLALAVQQESGDFGTHTLRFLSTEMAAMAGDGGFGGSSSGVKDA